MKIKDAAQYLPLIQGLANGRIIQMLCVIKGFDGRPDSTWIDCKPDGPLSFDDPVENYRLKPVLKLRPWKSNEVPVGAILRLKSDHNVRVQIVAGDAEKCYIGTLRGNCIGFSFTSLEDYEWAWPQSDNWQPCGVLE